MQAHERTPTTSELIHRVETLERATKRLRIAATTFGAFSLLCITSALSPSRQSRLEASEFLVTDDAGIVHARLGLSDSGKAGLWLMNEEGVVRASLAIADHHFGPDAREDDVQLALNDAEGFSAARLGIEDNFNHGAERYLRFHDGEDEYGDEFFYVGGGNAFHGSPELVFRKSEKPVISLTTGVGGASPQLSLLAEEWAADHDFGARDWSRVALRAAQASGTPSPNGGPLGQLWMACEDADLEVRISNEGRAEVRMQDEGGARVVKTGE